MEAPKPLVILLLGSAGSGKSSFIKSVFTGPDVDSIKLNHAGQMPCTAKCQPYTVDLIIKGRPQAFTLIDTPGFVNEPDRDLRTLDDIATTLIDMRQAVSGVVCFYDITYLRASGTSLSDISLFKLICGKSFFPYVACVTTMWDTIRAGQQHKYEAVHNTLGQGPLNFQGSRIFKKTQDDEVCALAVLGHIYRLAASGPVPPKLQIVRELENRWRPEGRGVSARSSSAGLKISKKTAESTVEYDRVGRGCCVVM